MQQKLLGVKIDYVGMDQVIETIQEWLPKSGKHYMVTPNPEMLVDAGLDQDFKIALNSADLSLPDSPRLGWASKLLESKSWFFRLIYLPFFFLPRFLPKNNYPTTTGTDLMESLIGLSEEKAYVTAYLGGSQEVADKLFKCLSQKYPKLKIAFCSGNIQVDDNGKSRFDIKKDNLTSSKDIKSMHPAKTQVNAHTLSQKIDILFVAFGHKKQEKWMKENINKLNAKVMVGVGGAFDYLSGSVPRAPLLMRQIGLEWLFRFLIQPWRIKRFWKLPVFVYKVITEK